MGMVMNYISEKGNKDLEVILEPVTRSAELTLFLPQYKKIYLAVKDYLRLLSSLKKTLRREQPDVVHIVSSARIGLIRDWLFVRVVRRYKMQAIVHYHCGYIPYILQCNGWQARLLRKVAKKSKKIVVLDQASLDALTGEGFTNVIKIGNCYNPQIDEHAEEKERKSNELLFVGHIVPDKGMMELLIATHDIPNIKLHCYGPQREGYMGELNAYIAEHPFKGEIIFHGQQKPEVIFDAMRKSTLFVLPTWWEGFPFVIVEAMASGCPVISTPIGAIEEMLTYNNELQGYLVPIKDPEQLRKQIVYCLEHLDEIWGKAEKAREKAQMEYSVDAMMNKLIDCWIN